MLKKIKNNIFLLFLIILSIVCFWRWIYYPVLTYGDWMFHFSNSISEWLSYPLIWLTSTALGEINIGLSEWPFFFIYGVFGFFHLNSPATDKILFMFPSVLLAALGGFFLVRKVTRSNVGAFIGSLVFTYNTYFILGRTGHLTLMTAFAFAPLALLFFIKTLEEKRLNLAIFTGLLFFVMSFYEFRAFYIFVWVCFFYFLWHTFIIDKLSWREFLKNIIFAFIPIALVFLLNLYWIIGLSKLGVISDNALFSRGLFGNSYMNLIESLTLFHPYWTGGKYFAFIVQPILLYFFLIPIFAFFGLWLKRKDKLILFFSFISFLGILLAKQVSPLFTNLYPWLYRYLPGFNAFREASKFYFLIALGYSVLIGSFVAWMWKNWKKNRRQIYLKYVLTILIAGIFLWNTKPLITGEIGTLFVPRHIPQDYIVFKDFILDQPEYFRTLWLPTDSRWSIYTNNHPKIGVVGTIGSDWLNFTNKNDKVVSEQKRISQILNKTFSNNLFDSSLIKYVIVPLQDKANDDDFFVYYGNDRNFYIRELDKIDWLKKIDIGTKELVVYENEGYRPHIYTTGERETIYKEVPYKVVDFRFINPTEYKISLKNISTLTYINFSEAFHQDWRVRVGEFDWFKVLTEKNYFIPNKYHYKNDAQLNSFLIDPAVVCSPRNPEPSLGTFLQSLHDKYLFISKFAPKAFWLRGKQYECKKNPDGSYDINLTLYFSPQSYFYLGLIISGLTLFGCLSYLVIYFVRSRKTKHPKHPKPLPQASTS